MSKVCFDHEGELGLVVPGVVLVDVHFEWHGSWLELGLLVPPLSNLLDGVGDFDCKLVLDRRVPGADFNYQPILLLAFSIL